MAYNQDLLQQLDKLLVWKKSKKFMAEKLGITESEVNDLLKELRDKDAPQIEENFYESIKKVNVEKGTIESSIVVDFEPKDDSELARLHKVNLDRYVISNYYSKLLPDGRFTSTVFSKLKTPKDYTPEDFAKFLENYKSNYIPIPRPETRDKRSVDIELSLSDFHLAKRTISDNETLQDRYNRFLKVATDLVEQADMMYDIDTIVLPISNDYFHTDNYQNQTTNGTPQDVIADYASEYEMGFTILVDTIKMLLSKANQVAVVLVQGNHDRTKSYYLAHALDVFFKDEKRVGFMRDHSVVKGIMLGETFIGYHHGNCKIEDLPLLFATSPEYSIAFGCSTYREVHTGDKHHYMTKEVKGVRIQQVPSLSGTDRWHADNNYVHSVRAALALVYDKKKGKFNEIEERI